MPKRKLSKARILFEIIILIFFVKPMFNLNYFTGIFYIIAIMYAFWKKIIFRRKNISFMILLGTLLSYSAGLFIPIIIGNYLAGDIVSAAIMGFFALLIWLEARKLKKGKR